MEPALNPLDLQLLCDVCLTWSGDEKDCGYDQLLHNQEMKKIVDMINYEIEYVLRPHTAPARFIIQLSP